MFVPGANTSTITNRTRPIVHLRRPITHRRNLLHEVLVRTCKNIPKQLTGLCVDVVWERLSIADELRKSTCPESSNKQSRVQAISSKGFQAIPTDSTTTSLVPLSQVESRVPSPRLVAPSQTRKNVCLIKLETAWCWFPKRHRKSFILLTQKHKNIRFITGATEACTICPFHSTRQTVPLSAPVWPLRQEQALGIRFRTSSEGTTGPSKQNMTLSNTSPNLRKYEVRLDLYMDDIGPIFRDVSSFSGRLSSLGRRFRDHPISTAQSEPIPSTTCLGLECLATSTFKGVSNGISYTTCGSPLDTPFKV